MWSSKEDRSARKRPLSAICTTPEDSGIIADLKESTLQDGYN